MNAKKNSDPTPLDHASVQWLHTSLDSQHPADTGSPCIKVRQTIGTSATTSDVSSRTLILTQRVEQGSGILIGVALEGAPAGTVSATDSAGNDYTVDVDRSNGTDVRTLILSSFKVDQLDAGDTITVSYPTADVSDV